MTTPSSPLDAARRAVEEHATPTGPAWLETALARIGTDPTAIRALFPAAARGVGRGVLPVGGTAAHLPGHAPGGGEPRWSVADAARALLLARLPAERLPEEAPDLYRYGDAAERRALLLALPLLDPDGTGRHWSVELLRDALRANDTRLIAAAVGPYAAHLDQHAWRQAVLKCLFTGVPLAAVADLGRRADAELATMLAGFALERVAAGRDVPADTWTVLVRFPGQVTAAGITAELDSPVPERARAAARALAGYERALAPTAPSDAAGK